MDERKKILLGNKDILSKSIEDLYISVNLSVDTKEIMPYKYDNVFDITKFYEKERNDSRNFVIYGQIDSYFVDCNDLKISVYQSLDFSPQNYLCTTYSNHIVNENMQFNNMYNKKRGKYIINNIPKTFTGCSVYLKIETQPSTIYNILEQQLIFTTLTLNKSGERVVEQLKYGLNEAITDCDGNIFEINNDFDFFYNKHWIKKNLYFLDLTTEWIGDESSKSCEMKLNPIFHDRVINGTFNTGFFYYNRTMEVYRVNMSPTGNIENNIIGTTTHYIPKILSNGECQIPNIYTIKASVNFIPNDSNSIYTAPTENLEIVVSPDDFNYVGTTLADIRHNARKYFQTENLTFETINNNINWEFKYFNVNGLHITQPIYNIIVSNSSIIEATFGEKCPWEINFTVNFVDNDGSITVQQMQNIIVSPNKNKFTNNELVEIVSIEGYYIDSYVLNEEYFGEPIENKISFIINNNVDLIINYKKYVKIKIKASIPNLIGSVNILIKLNDKIYNAIENLTNGIDAFSKYDELVNVELITTNFSHADLLTNYERQYRILNIIAKKANYPIETISFNEVPTSNPQFIINGIDTRNDGASINLNYTS